MAIDNDGARKPNPWLLMDDPRNRVVVKVLEHFEEPYGYKRRKGSMHLTNPERARELEQAKMIQVIGEF